MAEENAEKQAVLKARLEKNLQEIQAKEEKARGRLELSQFPLGAQDMNVLAAMMKHNPELAPARALEKRAE
eukprot:1092705-Lingulodinium_polyedra.AAC.1